MAVYKVHRRLPTAHSTQIGRIITRWAYLEWSLRNSIYALLDIGPPQGRIAIREQRAERYVDTVEDLLRIAKIDVDFEFKKYKDFLRILREHRNSLTHGIWLKHPDFNEPVLQITKGTWNPQPSNPKTKTKRVIKPEAALIRLKELRKFVPLIDQAIYAAGLLEGRVTGALASSHKKSY